MNPRNTARYADIKSLMLLHPAGIDVRQAAGLDRTSCERLNLHMLKRRASKKDLMRCRQSIILACLEDVTAKLSGLEKEAMMELGFSLREVVAGFEAELLTPIRKGPGSPGTSPTKRGCQEDAVRYILAVEAGLLDDPSPIKTVALAFSGSAKPGRGLERRTVSEWKENLKDGIDIHRLQPYLIETLMRFSGRCYATRFTLEARSTK